MEIFLISSLLIVIAQRSSWVVEVRPIVRMWDLDLQGVLPTVRVFMRDPSSHLREFRRKSQKIQNDLVDKHDRELNSTPPVYQLRGQNRLATGGAH